MKQESLDFGRIHRVSGSVRSVYRHLADAIDQVGILPAAGACGADRGDLRKAIDRDGRFVRVEWAMSIGAMCGTDMARAIGSALIHPFGFRLADEVSPMTDKERADRAEAALLALGAVGRQALEEVMGRR